MERSVLLEVWRESCRHIELAAAWGRIAEVVGKRLAFRCLFLRRIDAGRGWIDTLAASDRAGAPVDVARRTEADPAAINAISDWASQGRMLHRSCSALEAQLPGLVPSGLAGDALIAPLPSTQWGPAAVGLVAAPGTRFREEDATSLRSLLEPFAVALDNDHRLAELERLREAAEAERRSLLTRLGREGEQDPIVGSETGLRVVMERVSLVAKSDAPVLIIGETGSGKEVVARQIHLGSQRTAGPFLRVNCGAIPPELIDSELFGHERGSFTGATARRQGWFERADNGTLFLDEIGELSLDAQVRLLRILQDGTFQRVGGQDQLGVDVRVVAATHRDLRAMIALGRFREDLWYRIAVFPIQLPPLRERTEDIPSLAGHFALRAARRYGLVPRLPTPRDEELLMAYPWPGNVRELASVMERATLLGDGRGLEVPVALGIGGTGHEMERTVARHDFATEQTAEFATLDAAMRGHIQAALERTGGRIEGRSGAARLLGINPHTLRARMRKLGVEWRRFRPPSPP